MNYKLYKFLTIKDGKLVSEADKKTEWVIGKWNKFEGTLEACKSGFHASRRIVDAQAYTQTEILAEVEVRGASNIQTDKEAWSEMCIIRAWHWTKEDSVRKAIFAAELVIDIFEKEYPEDDRPRLAIKAAKTWLEHSTRENSDIAEYAAYTAHAAANAAHAAADTANAATYASRATYAAADVTYATYTAYVGADVAYAVHTTYAAAAVAYAANAANNILDKVEEWHLEHLKNLKPYVADSEPQEL